MSTTGLLSKSVKLYMTPYSDSPSYGSAIANLQNFPDLLGSIESVEITCLDDSYRRYIPGIQSAGDTLTFTFLYEKNVFNTIYSATGRQCFQVEFPDGVKIQWTGYVRANILGKGVNEALQFVAQITPDSNFNVVLPSQSEGTEGTTGVTGVTGN